MFKNIMNRLGLYRIALPATLTHSHPLSSTSATPTHSHSFFNKNNSLPPVFKKGDPRTHFWRKTTLSHPFFDKNVGHPPIFEQKRPIPQFFNKTTHSQSRALLNSSTSHSHPLPAAFTHSQAFLSFYTAIFYESDLLWRAFLIMQLISGP